MKLPHAQKILEKYHPADMLLMPGLPDAELSRRLALRNSAITEMMQQGGINYLQSYTLLSKIIRRHLHNTQSSKIGNRKEWKPCSVCGRPAFTARTNPKPLCKAHLRTAKIHKKLSYLKRLKMLGKVRMNRNKNRPAGSCALLPPSVGADLRVGPVAPAVPPDPPVVPCRSNIEVLNQLEQRIVLDALQDLVVARQCQPELFRVLVDEIVTWLEGEFDHPRPVLEASLLYYLDAKAELLWKQARLF